MVQGRRERLKTFERGTILAKIVGGTGAVIAVMTGAALPGVIIGVAVAVVHQIDKELQSAQARLGDKLTRKEIDKFGKAIAKAQTRLNGMMRRTAGAPPEVIQLCEELHAQLHGLRDDLRRSDDIERRDFTARVGALGAGLETVQKAVGKK